jgi:glyoxylase-like metal-dependent hydrolase (beta-lactamase superfamily II)
MNVVHRITTGRWRQNGYVVEEPGGSALIIDPGAEPERYLELLQSRELTPLAILNTHAHYDHIGGISALRTAYAGLAFYLHGADRALLRQANVYRAIFEASKRIAVPTDFIDLAELGNEFEIGGFALTLIATPGHTNGGVCFLIGSNLYTGDTLLPSGVGRTDLPGGSPMKIKESIGILERLPVDLMMHPGHGEIVRLGDAVAKLPAQSAV